ncbi:hypothetical protein [Deinococcus sonorensis]|uniref:Uncharacterized protein n=2 Tax=Deinococcus sonorensis TaxID=309891 RepID=A0AAU7U8L6_9DEIO
MRRGLGLLLALTCVAGAQGARFGVHFGPNVAAVTLVGLQVPSTPVQVTAEVGATFQALSLLDPLATASGFVQTGVSGPLFGQTSWTARYRVSQSGQTQVGFGVRFRF